MTDDKWKMILIFCANPAGSDLAEAGLVALDHLDPVVETDLDVDEQRVVMCLDAGDPEFAPLVGNRPADDVDRRQRPLSEIVLAVLVRCGQYALLSGHGWRLLRGIG